MNFNEKISKIEQRFDVIYGRTVIYSGNEFYTFFCKENNIINLGGRVNLGKRINTFIKDYFPEIQNAGVFIQIRLDEVNYEII